MIARIIAAAAVAAALVSTPSLAQRTPGTLTMGVRAPIVSLDPGLSGLGTMHGYYQNVFDSLVVHGSKLDLLPGLATSWRVVDDLTWEFKLRDEVKCHDGTMFDAAAVGANIRRLPTVPNSDYLTAGKMRPIKQVEVVDPLTIRFHTDQPYPGLLAALPELHLLCSSALARSPTTETIDSGRDAIGTGPFRNVRWTRGGGWELERFDDWWGDKSSFKHVSIREIPNDAARMASLQAGDIDMADYIPPLDVKRLSRESALSVFQIASARTLFLGMDSVRERVPSFTDDAGQPLPINPLKDLRVRQAIALAINQDLIVDRVMEGLAVKATQGMAEGMGGYAQLPFRRYDPVRAKALLAEAGFPTGFRGTLTCPNDRYVNDAAICQAVGTMLARVGIQLQIDLLPSNVYMPRLTSLEFSFYLQAWGNSAGDAATFLRDVMSTRNRENGTGSWNLGLSMPDLDTAIGHATMTMDLARRNQEMAQIMATLIERQAYIPLHTQVVIVATRKPVLYSPNADEATRAIDASLPR